MVESKRYIKVALRIQQTLFVLTYLDYTSYDALHVWLSLYFLLARIFYVSWQRQKMAHAAHLLTAKVLYRKKSKQDVVIELVVLRGAAHARVKAQTLLLARLDTFSSLLLLRYFNLLLKLGSRPEKIRIHAHSIMILLPILVVIGSNSCLSLLFS